MINFCEKKSRKDIKSLLDSTHEVNYSPYRIVKNSVYKERNKGNGYLDVIKILLKTWMRH
jgi:hypothetical protein